ncbi:MULTISPECIES: DUF1499 domain-containing protein [Halomonadaceae]|uniref:DUF1499 domain-containing protein n=1 Tax=Vreelandella halophila TaxID=86177 RepID=A0A9X4YDZ2_9GAMM|nr:MULTISPECIES: DUF1499 domain-containing protein [Halomonas]MYL26195.1 DUF1499 domain-containing protein [Halomonas utahensis]MYL73243.1 DUF1499 domain-containing protein [Halomonas sp. 22501_18_FS]
MSTDAGSPQLRPCPRKPNCVSSQGRGKQYIEPLPGDEGTWERLPGVLEALGGVRLVEQTAETIRAEARTRVLRFVDDLDFVRDPEQGVIQVRSASRLGYSDFGVNRRRLETVRSELKKR